MDILLYAKYLMVLIFVLGLIGLLTYVVRRFGFIPMAEKTKNTKKRLAITQMIGLDAKRRLILIRRDNKEHLLLLGPDGDTVIETDIPIVRRNPGETENTDQDFTADVKDKRDANEHDELHEPRLPSLKPVNSQGKTSL